MLKKLLDSEEDKVTAAVLAATAKANERIAAVEARDARLLISLQSAALAPAGDGTGGGGNSSSRRPGRRASASGSPPNHDGVLHNSPDLRTKLEFSLASEGLNVGSGGGKNYKPRTRRRPQPTPLSPAALVGSRHEIEIKANREVAARAREQRVENKMMKELADKRELHILRTRVTSHSLEELARSSK